MHLDAVAADALRAAARGALGRRWPVPPTRDGEAADGLWSVAVELGWTDLGGDRLAMAIVSEELGRAACPWPLVEVCGAMELFAASDDIVAGLRDGTIRPGLVDAATGLAELSPRATHGLVLTATDGALAPILRTDPMDEGQSALATVELGERIEVAVDPAAMALVIATLGVGLVARAVGAARRAHELGVQHAIDRVQFGRPIGSFQAVSHRLADAAVDLAGWDVLRDELPGADGLELIAVAAHGRVAAVRALGAAQRTLGAMGYFDEHALPWLFRRVHLDLDRQISASGSAAPLGQAVLAGARLRSMDLGPEAAAIVARLEADLDELGAARSATLDDDPQLVEALGERGWIAPGLSPEVGGLGVGILEQMAVDVVLQRRQVPVRIARGMAATLAGVIEQFGSDEQRETYLSLIARGRFRCYLGYSEPDVGSDLASLRTKAVRDGDEWIVDGTKMWGTGAHRADYVWLATRTNPDAADRREGITVFLAPTGLPGWSCTQHRALSGEVSCTTVFDGVRIADTCRVGEVDGGWRVITSALAAERIVMAGLAGEVGRQLDELATTLGGTDDPAAALVVADLAVRQRVAEALLEASTRSVGELGGFLQAAMAKLVTSELAEDLAQAAHELLGIRAAHGDADQALRLAPMYVIGGGTADIQRNLIARSLGLPRS